MWWIIFTAVDLYICLVIFKSLEPSLVPAKQRPAAIAEKAIIGSLIGCAAAIVFKLWR
jgi:hypothetical protein